MWELIIESVSQRPFLHVAKTKSPLSNIAVSPSSQIWNTNSLLLDSTTDELLFIPLTELEEFFSATDELDFLESFWEDEDAEPLSSLLLDEISPIGSGAELLDSSPHAASRARRMDRAKALKIFTEDLRL
jgi:hypothetical protein